MFVTRFIPGGDLNLNRFGSAEADFGSGACQRAGSPLPGRASIFGRDRFASKAAGLPGIHGAGAALFSSALGAEN